MPCKNEYVNYAAQGICKIEDIRPIRFGADPRPRNYYVLRPVHRGNAQVFVPADNPQLVDRMRPILSAAEIDAAICSVRNKELEWISDRKERAAQFQEILSRREEKELLLLVSCLYLHGQQNPRGRSPTDAQTLRQAETIIAQEFSFSLGIGMDDIGSYIRQKLNMPNSAGA